ncbi:MAG TPA: AMP-binding protein, partial [Usitatibacter sp.]|nr:AMP-binding protein [Usitatibacter sp.]
MNVAAWLDRAARADPARVAIVHGTAPWATYGDLARRVSRLAAGLRGRAGLVPGDRVALFMKNAPEYLEAMYAIWWAGLVAVPVNAKLHPEELAWIVEDSGARVVFESPVDLDRLRADDGIALAATQGSALAWLFYTSGTTGRPKGAMLSHRNLVQMT